MTGMVNSFEMLIMPTTGLKPEEQLIIRGYETLRDNSKIKIQK